MEYSVCHERGTKKKSASPTGIEPMTSSLSHARDKLNIPSIPFPSELKIYHLSFFIITHGAFDIADPSSMEDACHNELSKCDLARHESPSSSVVRAPDRCTGGHGFDSRGLRFFLCLTLVTNRSRKFI